MRLKNIANEGVLSMLCAETIEKLADIYKDDQKIMSVMERCIKSFEEYHQVIFKMELWIKLYSKSVSADEYKDNISQMDNARTMSHNSVLGNVKLLNRLAEKNELAPVYNGVVSEERPYRREVANAVLEYIEFIIKERN